MPPMIVTVMVPIRLSTFPIPQVVLTYMRQIGITSAEFNIISELLLTFGELTLMDLNMSLTIMQKRV